MSIYLLRHEKRFDIRHFDTDLTDEGHMNAKNLAEKLINMNFDYIFVSPYKRVIQTIEPYLINSNKNVNPEYGIYESLHLDTDNSNIREVNEKLFGYKYFDTRYKSCIKMNELKPGESYQDIIDRSSRFVKELSEDIKYKNKNILIVSHMSVINAILNRDEGAPYEMGELRFLKKL